MDEAEKKLNNKIGSGIQSGQSVKRLAILDGKDQRFMEKVAKPYPHCVICKNKPTFWFVVFLLMILINWVVFPVKW